MFQPMRDVLDRLEGAPNPTEMEVRFHEVTDEEAVEVLRRFPELNWEASRSGQHQWVSAFAGEGVEITLFVNDAKAVRRAAREEKK